MNPPFGAEDASDRTGNGWDGSKRTGGKCGVTAMDGDGQQNERDYLMDRPRQHSQLAARE